MNIIKMSYSKQKEMSEKKYNVMYREPLIGDFIFDDFALILFDCPDGNSFKFVVKYEKDKTIRYRSTHTQYNKTVTGEYLAIWDGGEWKIKAASTNQDVIHNNPEYASFIADLLIATMQYLMFEIQERKRKKMPSPKRHTREYRKSCVTERVFLMDDLYIYAKEKADEERKHHEMLCPCWEVRGHYRHLKSGKVVFIKAYKKGKEKNKTEPMSREYFL